MMDHKALGQSLDLFYFSTEAPGMPFYLNNGKFLLERIKSSLKDHLGEYEEVETPQILNQEMWEKSGHWEHYQRNMYFTTDGDRKLAVKPMNCPGHMMLFARTLRSYNELPIRYCEFGKVHRNELHGALDGLMRARAFTQDDAHLFVRESQIKDEIGKLLKQIESVYTKFGLKYSVELSLRPSSHMGDESLWDLAESTLMEALKEHNTTYTVSPGNGAFYGPKIDIQVETSIGSRYQCGTIQLDFQMPQKFELSYIGEDNGKHTPVVIHRAICGSLDRFLGILIEHYQGDFPDWLAPIQVAVIPVSSKFTEQAKEFSGRLGLRTKLFVEDGTVSARVVKASDKKIPYIIVFGEKETTSDTFSVRKWNSRKGIEFTMSAFRHHCKL